MLEKECSKSFGNILEEQKIISSHTQRPDSGNDFIKTFEDQLLLSSYEPQVSNLEEVHKVETKVCGIFSIFGAYFDNVII